MKRMAMAWVALMVCTGIAAAGGGEGGDDEGGATEPHQKAAWRASGTHECFAGSAIHRTCNVSGEGYASCGEAKKELEADDCCPRSDGGGKSIEFSNFVCSPI